jgi:hypothetical protein
VKRICHIIDFSDTFNRYICVDKNEADIIADFLGEHEGQFQRISDRILEQRFMKFTNFFPLVGYDNLWEMRFNVGGANGRIYCQEIRNKQGYICIVMSRLLDKKKVTKWDKSIIQIAKAIEKYEYEIED